MAASADDVVVMGEVTGVYGIRGWIKLYSYSRPPVGILEYRDWLLDRDGHWQHFPVIEGRVHVTTGGKTIVAHLEGIADRDQARSLIGSQVAISRDQLPELPEGEYYWAELTGLEVANLEGVPLGKVEKLMETGANDVLVVVSADAGERRERLIPYIPEVVREVDLAARRMQVDWDPEF